MMHSGTFREIATTGQQQYAERRSALSTALDSSLFNFDIPDGGYFLWLELPEGVTSSRAVVAASQHGVQVSDGQNFYVDRTDSTAVRVSFSMLDAELLIDGASRLNCAVRSLTN